METAQFRVALDLVESIYFSANHPHHWQSTLAAIAKAIDASGCALWMSDLDQPEVGMMATTFKDRELLRRHQRDYAATSPLFLRLAKKPPGRIYTQQQLMSRAEFEQTPMYREFWRTAGIKHSMGGFISRQHNRVAVIWVYRQQPREFSPSEAAFMDLLFPHLAQAMTLRSALIRAETLAQTGMLALDRLSMAMLLLDDRGRPVAYNTCTQNFVEAGILCMDGEALQLTGVNNNRQLQALIASMYTDTRGPGVLPGGGFKLRQEAAVTGEVEVLVLPYKPLEPQLESLMAPVAVIVFIKNVGSAPIPREPLLRDLYGLTGAEVRVCAALLDGVTIKEIAEQQRVTMGAIRFHCKNILRKTGTKRQSDLIRTLSHSLINLGVD